jgi:hypothetical protein
MLALKQVILRRLRKVEEAILHSRGWNYNGRVRGTIGADEWISIYTWKDTASGHGKLHGHLIELICSRWNIPLWPWVWKVPVWDISPAI